MKRKIQSIKLSRETLYRLEATDFRWVGGGGLQTVRAGCLTDGAQCDTHLNSCPTQCLTDKCNTRTLC